MKLSLCMIVKDEENNLRRCLESVRDVVDEMIVVDTGSTDSTVSIAESFGASVYYFPWNGSFSDARNHSLKQATGDWIMIMDADDELDIATKQAVRDLLLTDVDAYYFETISYVGEKPGGDVLKNLNLRLMRNHMGFFYSRPIHEQIHCNILAKKPDAKIVNLDLKVYHYGYLQRNIDEHDKRARNICLLERELEQRPEFAFTLFNLGSEYYAMGDNITAIGYFEKAHRGFDPKEGFSSHLLLKMAHCYASLGKQQDALNIIEEALTHYPRFTDMVYLRATIFQAQNKTYEAMRSYFRCLKMGEAPSIVNVIIGSGTYRPRMMIGQLYFNMEDYVRAAEQLKIAYGICPDIGGVLALLIRCYCNMGLANDEIERRIVELRTGDIDEFEGTIGTALMEEKYYELAIIHFNGIDKPDALYQKALCKLYLKQYDAAYRIMTKLKTEPPYYDKAVCMQALCRVSGGRGDLANKLLAIKRLDSNSPTVKVFRAFIKLHANEPADVLCEDEDIASLLYTPVIFAVLKALLITHQLQEFENALPLLNTVTDHSVLLRLAKLYYAENCFELAHRELICSIQTWGVIDLEGAKILYKLKQRGF